MKNPREQQARGLGEWLCCATGLSSGYTECGRGGEIKITKHNDGELPEAIHKLRL